jgi:cytochrome c-type biogenesis protein CcmH
MSDRVIIVGSRIPVFRFAFILLIALAVFQVVPARAQEYVELSPELDARAAALYSGIMCPQCNGQTISQSHAQIAKTMRQMVRERLKSGDTDDEIYAFMVSAFGRSVLASPPTSGVALTVWIVPPVMLLLGAIAVFLVVQRLKREPDEMVVLATASGQPGTDSDLAAYLDLVDNEMQEGPTRG